jgi:Icc-related predicted phosphoesterase
MKRFLSLSLLLLAVITLTSACKKEVAPPPEPVKPVAKAQPTPPPPPKSDPTCVGPVTSGTPEKVTVGDQTWELNGSTLVLKSALKKGELVIGAVTDIKEDSDENKGNLKKLVDFFKKNKAQIIIVAGDTGQNQKELEGALDVLAAAKIPVFNIIGNREGKTEYRKAMVALRAKHGNVFDLNMIRKVETSVVDIVSMPGYFNPSYLHNDDGCLYYPADLDALSALVKTCKAPALIVSHGGPKQEGPEALDRTAEGENRGDPGLAKVMADNKVPFGIFGNFHEAGGRATDFSGATRLEETKAHDALYINPGPADAVKWMMNDGSESEGMGAILILKDGKITHKIHRIGGKAAPKAGAKGKKAKGK